MELQLALDLVNISEAKEVVQEVQEYIDIVEIGTPVVINEGLKAVKEIKGLNDAKTKEEIKKFDWINPKIIR